MARPVKNSVCLGAFHVDPVISLDEEEQGHILLKFQVLRRILSDGRPEVREGFATEAQDARAEFRPRKCSPNHQNFQLP